MTLAAGDIMVIVIGVFILGFLAFFAFMAAMVVRFFTFIFHQIKRSTQREPLSRGPTVRLCSNARCGYLNPAEARYCARCGQALEVVSFNRHG